MFRSVMLGTWATLTSAGGQLFTGGPIYPMTDAPWVKDGVGRRPVKALAVNDGRIAYVGDDLEEARAALDNGSALVDLKGQTLLPAFIDAHSHLSSVAEELDNVCLWPPKMGGDVTSIEQMIERLSSAEPLYSWIIGYGYDQTLLAENRHPTRWDLDKASIDIPIWVRHVAGHSGVGNSKALELAGLTRESKPPFGCDFKRDATGELNGMLEEGACMFYINRVLPNFDVAMRIHQLERATKYYLSQGYTTAQHGYSSPEQSRCLEAAAEVGRLHCRVVVLPGGPEHLAAVTAGVPKDEILNVSVDPTRLSIGAVKYISDGSISIRTAYVREAYDLKTPELPEGYCAYPHYSLKEITDGLRTFHKAGYKLAVHTNGDAAVDQVLTALETIAAEEGPFTQAPVFIHSEYTHPDQLDRMQSLGASPSFFNLHVFYWWMQWTTWAFAAPEHITPMHGALERHMVYSSHTDSPIVDLEALRVVWSAVTRQRGYDDRSAGDVVGPSERVDTYAAFWGLTDGAARQWDLSHDVGSLAVGKRADFVLLDRDPFTLQNPDELLEVSIVSTIVDGCVGFSTSRQPLAGLCELPQGKPLLTGVPTRNLTSPSWASHPHASQGPTLAAMKEARQGACKTKSPHRASTFPTWFNLLLGCFVVLVFGLVSFFVIRLYQSSKHARPSTECLQVSLQMHDTEP